MVRGTIYPAQIDSTWGRNMELGAWLTPKASGIHNALNARAFKSNLLAEPFSHPGNQIQQFRTTGANAGVNSPRRIVEGAALNQRRFAR